MGLQVRHTNTKNRGSGLIFTESKLKGAFVVDIAPINDDRGFFARSWCRQEFHDAGLDENLVQCSVSFNRKKGTLRGMHYQKEPHGEIKLVRCTRGSIMDVIIDLRPESETFKQWLSVTLSESNHRMLYIPKGFAHGFCTMEDNVEVFYQMSTEYKSDFSAGVRWDDPEFGIEWPDMKFIMSERDREYPSAEL